ncbi:hypothetical protein Tco_0818167 [Tanacetum coccineum]
MRNGSLKAVVPDRKRAEEAEWTKHGEEDVPSISAPKPVNATTDFVDDMDFAYIPTDGPTTIEMVNATKDNFDVDDLVKFQELLLDVEKPLYEGCIDFTKFSAIVKLLNLKGKYEASDKFFTELLGLIKKMLPAGNEMKNDKDLTACRTCRTSRWKVDNKTKKVYENIPAKAWRTIDEKFPEIAKDTRNLRLGISADGVDINTRHRYHSVWPVLTVIYNLPPWLCMKRKFINLSVLISGYLGNDIDVFLEPLVDDLHTLFETGVDTYDASTEDNFNLRAVVLWIINDYPALGTLYGCLYSGFKGCVVCGKDTNCVKVSASSKQKKNVAKSIVGTLLPVPGKTKDGLNARLDLAELGVKPELFAMQDEEKTTLPPVEGCIGEETMAKEIIEIFSEYHKSMETIGIPPDKHETYENEEGKPLSAKKTSEVFAELFQKAHLYVIQNTYEIVPYIE